MPRHAAFVRITHWIHAISFLCLVLSGIAILLAYPRLHWGESGTVGSPSLIDLPLPFVLELGIRGPGRYLHFLSTWVVLFCGSAYVAMGVRAKHFSSDLLPPKQDFTWTTLRRTIADHLHFRRPRGEEEWRYNLLQRISYLAVVFVLSPFMFLTGLAMSPMVTSVFPWLVEIWGGRQSARTLHFFGFVLLVIFFLVHIVMVVGAGFVRHCAAMITGYSKTKGAIQRLEQEP